MAQNRVATPSSARPTTQDSVAVLVRPPSTKSPRGLEGAARWPRSPDGTPLLQEIDSSAANRPAEDQGAWAAAPLIRADGRDRISGLPLFRLFELGLERPDQGLSFLEGAGVVGRPPLRLGADPGFLRQSLLRLGADPGFLCQSLLSLDQGPVDRR